MSKQTAIPHKSDSIRQAILSANIICAEINFVFVDFVFNALTIRTTSPAQHTSAAEVNDFSTRWRNCSGQTRAGDDPLGNRKFACTFV